MAVKRTEMSLLVATRNERSGDLPVRSRGATGANAGVGFTKMMIDWCNFHVPCSCSVFIDNFLKNSQSHAAQAS